MIPSNPTPTEFIQWLLTAGAGYGLQWLRGWPWFNDQATVLVWALGGVAITLLTTDPCPGPGWTPVQCFLFHAAFNASIIAGGQSVGHLLSRNTPLAPKFNQFTQEVKK